MEDQGRKPTAVVVIATVALETSSEITSGNNLPTDAAPVTVKNQ